MDAKSDIKNNDIIIPRDKTSNAVQRPRRIEYSDNVERNCGTEEKTIEGPTVELRRKIDRKRADVNKKLWRRSTMERSGLPPPPVPPDSPPTSPDSFTKNKTPPPISPPIITSVSTLKSNVSSVSPTNNNVSPPISTEKMSISRKRQSLIKRQSLPPPPLPPSSP
ncbi:hypothetical protein LOTGIDRAFT_157374 [Lottia gigantea]|uniref:Uncharacterized protein n=1 Tax=Lottia gigantea TaxID=225164 RepID=V4CJ34_LOTGI|nr:hypothetical protein LOTGIDRAFT_157374 [Lottia gigantea]ESP02215.1 hypothetical protein LOTGIDRAFT_157374 [Lottia gigantea]